MGFFELMEFLKDLLEVLLLDPKPGVGYGKFETFFVCEVSHSNFDFSPRGEFICVADQVLQNLLELQSVCADRRQIRLHIPKDFQTAVAAELPTSIITDSTGIFPASILVRVNTLL